MTSIDSEELNVILYRYSPDNNKYEGASFSKLDPISQRPLPIAYSTDIKPLIEPSFGEALYFIDNEWVIRDEYVNGVFYKKSDGGMEEKVKVKDLDLYTEVAPTLQIKDGDMIEYVDDEWMYTYRVPLTLDELKSKKIFDLKQEGSKRIQTINGKYYNDIEWLRKSQNYQDAIARYFPLSLYQRLPDEQFSVLQEAISVISRKDRYVVRINEIEDRINKIDSLDDLNAIDVQSQQNWEGLD